ncbi:hypothetical protein [Bradyrhizobium sp. USDA 4469]
MSTAISRLEFDELEPRLQAILDARVKRLGYLGEFFKVAGHQPTLVAPFMEMTEALKQALPDRLTETGALTVARLMDNDYERHQHERLSIKLGFGHDWVAAVLRLDPDADGPMDGAERAVQRLVLGLIARRGKHVSKECDALIAKIGPERTIAVLFLVGRYMTHAFIVNALELAPPVPSIFEQAIP